MGNLGSKPALVALTSGDLGADIVTAAKIADDVLNSEHYAAASIDNEHLADNAVGTDEIADNAVTLAKMASGTDGNIISFDASGNPVAIATGSDGQVLTSGGAGAPPAFEAAAAGGITVQVVQNNVNTLGSQSISEDTVTNITNLNCAITPSANTSKILVQVHWFGETNDPQNMVFGIKRDSTEVGSAPQAGSRNFGITSGTESNIGSADHGSTPGIAFYQFIDFPNTTSETTYHATFRDGYAATTLFNNRTITHGTSGGYETGVSSITLTELSAATIQTNGS